MWVLDGHQKTLGFGLAGLASFSFLLLISGHTAQARSLTQRTEIRDYRVYGKTPAELVRYMKRRPFRGDNGPAMANIRPKYGLKLKTLSTRAVKGAKRSGCKVASISLDIRFVMTLPKAMQSAKQSSNTRHAWRSFRSFAKRHEEQHRRIYMGCAKSFLGKARKMTGRSCAHVKQQVNKLLKKEEKACDKKHLAFDRRDFPRVPNLALFRKAKLEKARKRQALRKKTQARATKPRRSAALGWFSSKRAN